MSRRQIEAKGCAEENMPRSDEVEEVTLDVSGDCRRVRIGGEVLKVNSLDVINKEWVIGKIEDDQREATGTKAKQLGAMLAKLKREMRLGGTIIDNIKVEIREKLKAASEAAKADREVETHDLTKDENSDEDIPDDAGGTWEIEEIYEKLTEISEESRQAKLDEHCEHGQRGRLDKNIGMKEDSMEIQEGSGMITKKGGGITKAREVRGGLADRLQGAGGAGTAD